VTSLHDEMPLREVVGYRGPRRRLMLVDDQPDHRAVVRDMLQPLGFLIEEAFDAAECLRRIDTFRPDALLIDLVMPGMSGIELARTLRGRGWSSPIIAISANVFERDREATVAAGCNGFVLKPVHFSDLLGQLQLHLSMQWVHASDAVTSTAQHAGTAGAEVADCATLPPVTHLLAMRQHARIGYMKGVTEEIERIGALDPAYRPYATRLNELAKQFRTADIVTLIEESMNHDGA
jgi:CheY-like chemotaxis protein